MTAGNESGTKLSTHEMEIENRQSEILDQFGFIKYRSNKVYHQVAFPAVQLSCPGSYWL